MQQTNTQRVISKVEQLVALSKEKYGLNIQVPVIVFDIRQNSRLIGQCLYSDPRVDGKSKLRFNLSYMAKNIEAYMEIVIHEFSHLATRILYGEDCGHDARFAKMVRSFGGKVTGAATDIFSQPLHNTPSIETNSNTKPVSFTKPIESNDAEKLAMIKSMLKDLSIDSLSSLNKNLIEVLKQKRVVVGNSITSQLKIGDIVEFTHPKTGRIHKIMIASFSRDGAKVKGTEVNGPATWTVPASMLRTAI